MMVGGGGGGGGGRVENEWNVDPQIPHCTQLQHSDRSIHEVCLDPVHFSTACMLIYHANVPFHHEISHHTHSRAYSYTTALMDQH